MMLAALKGYYDRQAATDKPTVPQQGYSDEKISFAIVLSKDGAVVDVDDLRETNGKKPQPVIMPVPASFKRPGIQPRAFFLWDKTSYALGVSYDKGKAAITNTPEPHRAFKELHEELLAGTPDPGLNALLAFLRDWDPDRYGTLRNAAEMVDTNVVFRLDGDLCLHQRSAAHDTWSKRIADQGGGEGLCLVTGARAPIARLHPAIKGVADAQTSGASIVSFNLDAFTSYGKSQGENAPVGEPAAFAYSTALNAMLRHGSRNKLQIADATTVFWAEAATADEVEAAEETFSWLAEPPPDDRSETLKAREFLEKIAKGRPLSEVRPNVAPETRFYILGLSPNAARIAVRFWHDTTLGQLAERFVEHWRDLAIEPPPRNPTPAIWALLYEIAAQRKSENIPPRLAGEVMRAILSGAPYPRMLLAQVIMRIRADHSISDLRIAILKACLARDHRLGIEKESTPVSLDRGNLNPGYRLGRLFAVLESAQKAALPGLNATIRDRFYGAASATPASVFPVLIRNTGNHLASLRKGDKPGLGGWLEKEMGEIMEGIGGDFPRSLSLQDQGRFAIGYYHQRFAKSTATPVEVEDTADADDNDA